jgi:hypothetical protein
MGMEEAVEEGSALWCVLYGRAASRVVRREVNDSGRSRSIKMSVWPVSREKRRWVSDTLVGNQRGDDDASLPVHGRRSGGGGGARRGGIDRRQRQLHRLKGHDGR